MAAINSEEGNLEIGDGVVKFSPHADLPDYSDTELQLSDVDSVSVTRSDIRPVARIGITVKGSERLAVHIPISNVKSTLKALTQVKEDAEPKTADRAERRTTEPEEDR